MSDNEILELMGIVNNGRPTLAGVMCFSKVSDTTFTKSGDIHEDLLKFCKTPRTRQEIAGFVELTQYYAINTLVMPLIEAGKLKMTIPDKPRSRNQKYVTVE